MTTENTIGEHLLGQIDSEQADRQITCNVAASHSITCACGAVLDEKTVCILQHQDDGKDWSCVATCCPDCQDSITGIVKTSIENALERTNDNTVDNIKKRMIDPSAIIGKWRWLNWTGETDIC